VRRSPSPALEGREKRYVTSRMPKRKEGGEGDVLVSEEGGPDIPPRKGESVSPLSLGAAFPGISGRKIMT